MVITLRSGIILAGGKSSRMGRERDKGLMKFGNKLLISYVMDILSPHVDEIIISLSKKMSYRYSIMMKTDVTFIEDKYENIGPIGGILSSFEIVRGEYVAVAPCDSPFIGSKLYPLLFELAKDHDGAVPKIGEYFEPLHAVYKRETTLNAMKKVMVEGKLKPIDAYSFLDLNFVNQEELVKIDPELKSFTNINTLKDLEKSLMKI